MGQQFFRVIRNPTNVRRQLLESSKLVIENLKSYQDIQIIRENKHAKIRDLKIQIKEIHVFLDKLREDFPPEIVEEFKKSHGEPKKGKKTKSKRVKKTPAQPPAELAKLESQLSRIEDKLKGLS